MAVENDFISSLLLHGEEEKFEFDGRFAVEILEDTDSVRAYEFIEKHYLKYRKFPSKKTFENEYPSYVLKNVQEPPDFYAQKCHDKWLHNKIAETVKTVEHTIVQEEGSKKAFKSLSKAVGEMSRYSLETTDVKLGQNPKTTYTKYEDRENKEGLVGIPYPWKTLNDITGGMQKGQFIVFVGQRKKGKTWRVITIAHHVHKIVGKTVLFVSPEMSRNEIELRYYASDAKVSYDGLRRGTLSGGAKSRFKDSLKSMKNDESDFYIADTTDASGPLNIKYVEGKILKYHPDLVIIDGLYLLMDEFNTPNQTQRLYNLTRATKAMAKRHRIPIIGVTQENRSSKDRAGVERVDKIAHADSFAQDADLMVGNTPLKNVRQAELEVLANREGVEGGIILTNWSFDPIDFDEIEDAARDATEEKEYEDGSDLY